MCSHRPPVLDTTERYCGSQLPIVRGERGGVNQDGSFVGAVVVRETCHSPTSARPWHGLSQLGRQWPSARSRASVRSQLAGIEQGAPLASPASAVLPLDSVSMAVWVAHLRERWQRASRSGRSDEWQDDVPAPPPESRQDFSGDGRPTRYRIAAALFRPPSPKPDVHLSMHPAFQRHIFRETDTGFRLIGLP